MADETIRSRIIAVLFGRVKRIRVANGFATNCGESAVIGEVSELGPDDPEDAISFNVGDDELEWQGPALAFYVKLPISIRALSKADCEPWKRVEAIVGDIKRAIETTDFTLGGLIDARALERGPVVSLDRESGSKTIGAGVIYRVSWKEGWGTP